MTEPYYKSPTRALYHFPNGYGASVVVQEGGLFSMAVTRPGGKTDDKAFWLDYNTPFGPPKDGVANEEIDKHLAEIEAFAPPTTVESLTTEKKP